MLKETVEMSKEVWIRGMGYAKKYIVVVYSDGSRENALTASGF